MRHYLPQKKNYPPQRILISITIHFPWLIVAIPQQYTIHAKVRAVSSPNGSLLDGPSPPSPSLPTHTIQFAITGYALFVHGAFNGVSNVLLYRTTLFQYRDSGYQVSILISSISRCHDNISKLLVEKGAQTDVVFLVSIRDLESKKKKGSPVVTC